MKQKKNIEWPFQENLLVQFTVSDIESKLKAVDVDNLANTLFDSLQGVVYSNDSQIVGFAGDKYSVNGIKAFIIGIRRLKLGEKAIYQEYLFSGKRNSWKEEYKAKVLLNRQTRFISYNDQREEVIQL